MRVAWHLPRRTRARVIACTGGGGHSWTRAPFRLADAVTLKPAGAKFLKQIDDAGLKYTLPSFVGALLELRARMARALLTRPAV